MAPFSKVKIRSTGIYYPPKVLTNFDLEKMVDTNDQWITERTGIKERRISSRDSEEFPTHMAFKATLQALEKSNLKADQIDYILFATTTPDYKLPNCASILQEKLKISNKCPCLDIAAACSGFLYGLNLGSTLIQSGQYKRILVVGAEMLSSEVDWTDRNTCILFGDAAGAFIIERNEDENSSSNILSTVMHSDGTGKDFFYQHLGATRHPLTAENVNNSQRYMQMNGREMFKVAVRTLAENSVEALKKANLQLEEIDWFVPHQANIRIIEACAKKLNFPMEKVIVNIDKFANTSAATIPLAFHQAVEEGKIKRGQKLLLSTFGAGLTSAATVVVY